jgi:hypothetical protein
VGKDKRVGRSSVKTKMIYYKERKRKAQKPSQSPRQLVNRRFHYGDRRRFLTRLA